MASLNKTQRKARNAKIQAGVAKKAAEQAVVNERATHEKTDAVAADLHSYILGTYGKAAVAVLGDFGMVPPKSKGKKSVVTKAVAVAKSKATREARGTKGAVQKKAVKGTVDADAIKSAIEAPEAAPAPAPTTTHS